MSFNPIPPSCRNLQVFPRMDTTVSLFSSRRQAVMALGCPGLAKHTFWLVSLSSASSSGKQGLIPSHPHTPLGLQPEWAGVAFLTPGFWPCGSFYLCCHPLKETPSLLGSLVLPWSLSPSLRGDHHMLILPIPCKPGEPLTAETQSWLFRGPAREAHLVGEKRVHLSPCSVAPQGQGAFEREADPLQA